MSHPWIVPSLSLPHGWSLPLPGALAHGAAPLAVVAALAAGLFVICLALALRGALTGGVGDARPMRDASGRVRDPRVARLARKGYTPLAIAARTGLPQDAVRALLGGTALAHAGARAGAGGGPRVPATRKFVPDVPAASIAAGGGRVDEAPAQRSFAARLNAALSRATAPGTRLA